MLAFLAADPTLVELLGLGSAEGGFEDPADLAAAACRSLLAAFFVSPVSANFAAVFCEQHIQVTWETRHE